MPLKLSKKLKYKSSIGSSEFRTFMNRENWSNTASSAVYTRRGADLRSRCHHQQAWSSLCHPFCWLFTVICSKRRTVCSISRTVGSKTWTLSTNFAMIKNRIRKVRPRPKTRPELAALSVSTQYSLVYQAKIQKRHLAGKKQKQRARRKSEHYSTMRHLCL